LKETFKISKIGKLYSYWNSRKLRSDQPFASIGKQSEQIGRLEYLFQAV